jgi:hypothetical protein
MIYEVLLLEFMWCYGGPRNLVLGFELLPGSAFAYGFIFESQTKEQEQCTEYKVSPRHALLFLQPKSTIRSRIQFSSRMQGPLFCEKDLIS